VNLADQNKAAAIDWLLKSQHTGVSSETLARHIADLEWVSTFSQSVPWDVYDFGRCVGLISELPHPKEALKKCRVLDGWMELIDRWDELTSLYDNDESWGGACNSLVREIVQRA